MNESQLIFIISQPRSGSSMLQQLIMSAPNIESIPEPWFMLSLIYTYKKNLSEDEHNAKYSQINFMNYLEQTIDGKEFYLKKIKEIALDLYSLSLKNKNNYFIDKTPRYYHIINELIDLFPNSKFIFLSRNPSSVFSSILNYNFDGDIEDMIRNDRMHDLSTAIKNIAAIKTKKLTNTYFINYEDLIQNPKDQLQNIFNFLEIECPKDMGKYSLNNTFSTTNAVDKKSLSNHEMPVADYVDNWTQYINTYQKKKILLDYLKSLKPGDLKILGYENLIEKAKAIKVKKSYFALPLDFYTQFPQSLKYLVIKKIRNILYDQRNKTQ